MHVRVSGLESAGLGGQAYARYAWCRKGMKVHYPCAPLAGRKAAACLTLSVVVPCPASWPGRVAATRAGVRGAQGGGYMESVPARPLFCGSTRTPRSQRGGWDFMRDRVAPHPGPSPTAGLPRPPCHQGRGGDVAAEPRTLAPAQGLARVRACALPIMSLPRPQRPCPAPLIFRGGGVEHLSALRWV